MNADPASAQYLRQCTSGTRLMNQVALTLLVAIALLWPAIVNGGPFWFPDTSNYVRAADGAVVYLTGSPSEWSDRLDLQAKPPAAAQPAEGAVAEKITAVPQRPVLVGRSIYYGFLLYLPMRVAGPWAAVIVQAFVVAGILAYVLNLVVRHYGLRLRKASAALAAVFLVATPLPFYATMLMPDIYTGVLVLCLVSLICLWGHLDRRDRLVLLTTCAIIATFHTTNLLVTIAIGVGAAAFMATGRQRLRPLAIIAPVLLVGILSILAFNAAVSRSLGQAPVSPPFLSARLTASGPGTAYLRDQCGKDGINFVLCRYQQRLPVHSDAFLWDENPQTAVYQIFTDAERRQVSREDARFLMAVLAHDPVGFVRASLQSSGQQLVDFDLEGFNLTDPELQQLNSKYPAPIARSIESTLAANGKFPLKPFSILTASSTLLSIFVLAAAWFSDRKGARMHSNRVWAWVKLIVLGVVANGVICGTLSGPNGRYQMRLIWLLPLVCALAAAAVHPATGSRQGMRRATQ